MPLKAATNQVAAVLYNEITSKITNEDFGNGPSSSVLPIRPCLEIVEIYTSRRSVVFELINHEFVAKFN